MLSIEPLMGRVKLVVRKLRSVIIRGFGIFFFQDSSAKKNGEPSSGRPSSSDMLSTETLMKKFWKEKLSSDIQQNQNLLVFLACGYHRTRLSNKYISDFILLFLAPDETY